MLPDQDDINYNCIATDQNGNQRKLYANWLHNNNVDYWQGWRCDAGHKRFFIDQNNDIYSGMCRNNLLGNLLEHWDTKTDTVCLRERCTGCTDDLIVEKYKVE